MARLDASAQEISAPAPAFLTDDCAEILQFAADCFDSGQGSALVTLVGITGGTARSIGAQMAVRGDARYCGYVSGGCTEAVIATEAADAIVGGCDRLLRLGEGSPFFDIALPCGGGITLAIHVIRDSMILRTTLLRLARRKRAGLAYDPAAETLIADFSGSSGWHDGVFIRSYRPKTRLLLSGGAIELDIVSRLAIASGFELSAANTDTPFPAGLDSIDRDTAVAILHHDLDREIPILKAALDARPFYLGALGSQRTHARRSEALRRLGYTDADISRIKAPIGIFPKARDSSSLALSVLAEIALARSVDGGLR